VNMGHSNISSIDVCTDLLPPKIANSDKRCLPPFIWAVGQWGSGADLLAV